jgi:uncharacterized protein YdiU (UPF0061 family)
LKPRLPLSPRSQERHDAEYEHDVRLVQDLLATMAGSGADFTNTFRHLAAFPTPSPAAEAGERPPLALLLALLLLDAWPPAAVCYPAASGSGAVQRQQQRGASARCPALHAPPSLAPAAAAAPEQALVSSWRRH